MIRGEETELGGKTFTIPPLTLDQLEEFEKDIAAASEMALDEATVFAKARLMAMARVIHAALTRNYDISLDDVKKLLDLGNVGRAWMATMGVSGLEKKDAPAGEAKAEAPQTGTASARNSAPSPAGAGTKPAA